MAVNKDELRELLENDLFGGGDFSLDDLEDPQSTETESETAQNTTVEPDLDQFLDIEETSKEELREQLEILNPSQAPQPLPTDLPEDDFLSEFSGLENSPVLTGTSEQKEDINGLIQMEEQEMSDFLEHTESKIKFSQEPELPASGNEAALVSDDELSIDKFLEDEPSLELTESIEEPLSEPTLFQTEEPPASPEESVTVREPASQTSQQMSREEVYQAEQIVFPEIEERISGQNFDLDFFADIPVKVDVFLGQTTISLKEIYALSEGSIIDLDKSFGEPLELKINGQIIALGDVVSIDKNYGIMIRDIVRNKK